jgi:hypothetical protein
MLWQAAGAAIALALGGLATLGQAESREISGGIHHFDPVGIFGVRPSITVAVLL